MRSVCKLMAGAKLSFTLPDMAIQEIVPHHTQEIAPEIEKKEEDATLHIVSFPV